MKKNLIESVIRGTVKGSFIRAEWEKPCKVKKAFAGKDIRKLSAATVRLGVTYDNVGNVQAKRESGELPQENAGLTWGRWSQFPYFIEHKGNEYLRMTLTNNNPVKSQWIMDGKPATLEDVKPYLLASELPKDGERPDVLTINIDNLKKLG